MHSHYCFLNKFDTLTVVSLLPITLFMTFRRPSSNLPVTPVHSFTWYQYLVPGTVSNAGLVDHKSETRVVALLLCVEAREYCKIPVRPSCCIVVVRYFFNRRTTHGRFSHQPKKKKFNIFISNLLFHNFVCGAI